MYNYTLLGNTVHTPIGPGRYLQHENGKVLVVFDYDCQPMEFDAREVWI